MRIVSSSGRWWWLAAALGAVTLWALVSVAHDTGMRREAAVVTARNTATHLAALLGERLEVLAAITFAPAAPWQGGPSAGGELELLLSDHAAALACACRQVAPALGFFHYRADRDRAEWRPVDDGVEAAAPVTAELLREVTLAAKPPLAGGGPRLLADPRLPGLAVIAVPRRHEGTNPGDVLGAVVRLRPLAHVLFRHDAGPPPEPPSGARVLRLDTLSLQVFTTDSVPLFGGLGADRPHRATVAAGGPLAGLRFTVALAGDELPHRVGVDTSQLWTLGFLLACTILVVIVAAGASRREATLARARSDFIAGVSHDLRMPLAQILLAGETLALDRAGGDGERRSLTASVVREARRLRAMVDNVLFFSRAGAVAVQPAMAAVAVDDLLLEVEESVGLLVADAGQELAREPAPGLAVRGDHGLLRQALANLVDNAIKYGPAGQRIRLGAARHEPGWVALAVTDEGPGIPEADRHRIFDAYERLPTDRESERTGSGLGLTVVRQIVVAHGGRALAESGEGGGTRMLLLLPEAAREATG